MNNNNTQQYDVIIIGSGTCGSTIARNLAAEGKSVLVLEKGADAAIVESVMGVASVAKEVAVSKGVMAAIAEMAGGSTGLYFGVVRYPQLADFDELGIDLSQELAKVTQDLPLGPLDDSLISPQSFKLRDSAAQLGLEFYKNDLLVDQSQCSGGYNFNARWRARSYLDDACQSGAVLITKAQVEKILIENNQAVGVQYQQKSGWFGSKTQVAHGKAIILAAGALASPQLLRQTGVKDIAKKGFYYDPGMAVFGLVPGLEGKNSFVGSMSCDLAPGVELGDANVSSLFYKLLMLSEFKFKHFFKYHQAVGIGVKVTDGLAGEIDEKGRFNKDLNDSEQQLIEQGQQAAVKILKQAGAEHIFATKLTSSGHVGGTIRIKEHVDENLQTQFNNLYVCDGSLLPENIRVTPTLTLVCLAEYLSKQLLARL